MPAIERALGSPPSTVRTFGVSWPLLVAFLGLLGVFGSGRSNVVLADPDTYLHLAIGRWILEHGAVPQSDPFSHSMPGAAWTAHEWLSGLVLSGVYEVAGWAGLVVATALLFAGTLAYVMRFLLARMEPVHALLLTVFAGSMLMSHLLARPHVLIWPLLAAWVGSLVDAGEQGRGPPWWLLPLMVLWTNLHGSFTLGLALGAALAVDAVLMCPPWQRRAAASRWAGFVGLSVAAAMFTPTGWRGLWFTVHLMQMTYGLDVITEWRSPDFHQPQMLELWLMLMLAIACAGRMRLPWLRLLLVLGLAHLALKHLRHVSILGLVSPFLIATPLARHWRATAGAGRDAESLDRVFRAFAAPAQLGGIAAVVLLAMLLVGTAVQSGRFAPPAANTPDAAVQAAVHAGVVGPVLNSYRFGGYLIYSGMPVFIDGRADMYGDTMVKRQFDALSLGEPKDLPRLLEDYRIGWTLLEPGLPALALLDRMPGWRRVYTDAVAVVHIRDGGNAAR
jgi:hypothetical protein